MKHPISKEQLTFERREYRADPIEGPEEYYFPDRLIGIVAVVLLILLAWGVL